MKQQDGTPLTGVTDIAGQEDYHYCAIYGTDDRIYCWGSTTNNLLAWNGAIGVNMIVVDNSFTCVKFANAPSIVECRGNSNWNGKSYDMDQTITKLTAGIFFSVLYLLIKLLNVSEVTRMVTLEMDQLLIIWLPLIMFWKKQQTHPFQKSLTSMQGNTQLVLLQMELQCALVGMITINSVLLMEEMMCWIPMCCIQLN